MQQMERGKLTDEQIKAVNEAAKQFVNAVKEMWERLKEFAAKIAPLFEKHFKTKAPQQIKQKFGSIAFTKGHIFKNQVQLNKPKFIQVRSNL